MNLPISAEEEGVAQKSASSGCGPRNFSCAHCRLGSGLLRALLAEHDLVRSRQRPKKGKHHAPPRNSTPRPRMAADWKPQPQPLLTSSYHLGQEQKGRQGTSANLSRPGAWSHFLSRPLGLLPASSVALRICVEGGRSWGARTGGSFIQIKLY